MKRISVAKRRWWMVLVVVALVLLGLLLDYSLDPATSATGRFAAGVTYLIVDGVGALALYRAFAEGTDR